MTEDYNNYTDYEDDMMQQPQGNPQKAYTIIIVVLTVALLALAFQYFKQVNRLRGSEAELTIERDTLQNRLADISLDFANLKTENDTINSILITERQRADSLMDKLKSERSWSYAKIKKYEKELSTLTTVLKGYVVTIDSLNQLNTKLSNENIRVKKELSSIKMRAESAEEDAQELRSKVRKGAIVTARDIDLKALDTKDREVKKAKRAARLRVDLVLNANPLAIVGEKTIYARIKGPGDVLLTDSNSYFDFEGEKLAFSAVRRVEYDGSALATGLYYNSEEIKEGSYKIELYMDGYVIGTNEIILR